MGNYKGMITALPKVLRSFGHNHVYTLSEANKVTRLNPGFVFLSLHNPIDLGQISLGRSGFNNKKISDMGRVLLVQYKEALPFKISGVLPVLLKSSNSQSTKLIFLFSVLADQIEGTNVMYQQGYYADFEANPSRNKKLEDSLIVWGKTQEFVSLRSRNNIRALILGSSYSGNYFALVR